MRRLGFITALVSRYNTLPLIRCHRKWVPSGQAVQTCPMTDFLCGGIQWAGVDGFDRVIEMFGGLYEFAVEQMIGVIGWAAYQYVQVEYLYQEWLAYLSTGFANNSTTACAVNSDESRFTCAVASS